MKANMNERSPAYRLVRLIWDEQGCKSWARINHSMRGALGLAIESCLTFGADDFAAFEKEMRGRYWLGSDREGYFVEACVAGNISACRAYEKWVGRRPFIFEGKRLRVGARIDPEHLERSDGRAALVTSFDVDGDSLIACTYDKPAASYARKPLRKIKVTLADVRAMEKKRKGAIVRTEGSDGQ